MRAVSEQRMRQGMRSQGDERSRSAREKEMGTDREKRMQRQNVSTPDPETTIDANLTDSLQAQPSGASMKERMSESPSCTMIRAPAP